MNRLAYDKVKLEELCRKYNLSLVILHGSYAKGIVTDKSDIDIGLLGDPNTIRAMYINILRDFTGIFGDKFDPVFLNSAEPMITYHVALKGMPLYEKKKGLFEEFRLGAFNKYNDAKKFRELEKQYIKSAIKEVR